MIINQVKQKLHLVGYLLIRYFKDARYHERKMNIKKNTEERVCRDPTPSDTPPDSESDVITVPFADDWTEEEKQEAGCVFCTGRFSEDHNGEERIRCAKRFRWAHTLCAGMEEDFVCEFCQRQTLFCFSFAFVIFFF